METNWPEVPAGPAKARYTLPVEHGPCSRTVDTGSVYRA